LLRAVTGEPNECPFRRSKQQYLSIKDEILSAVESVFSSPQFVLGREVAAFEEEFAAFCGTKYAVGVNSGTSALHLALLAAGIGPGDEVITVPCTFVATVAAIVYSGARPAFVDVDPVTYTMDPAAIAAAVKPAPRRSCRYICMAIPRTWMRSSKWRTATG